MRKSLPFLNESWYRYVFVSHMLEPSEMVNDTLLERNWIFDCLNLIWKSIPQNGCIKKERLVVPP